MAIENVKSLASILLDRVNTATEANDEERRRDSQEKKRQNKDETATANPTDNPSKDSSAQNASENELARQIVDSEKVLQLLSQKPKEGETKQVISKLKFAAKKETLPPQDSKKINRVL